MALFQYLSKAFVVLLPIAILALAYLWLRRLQDLRTRSKGCPLPPGPPGEPILGHLRVVPSHSPEYTYIEWSKKYKSDILSVNILGQNVIILNSVQAAQDLLSKRGANYSDRPRFVLFEVMGWGKTLTFLRWGDDFRLHRQILQSNFAQSSIARYRPIQLRETAVMLNGILDSEKEWDNTIRRFATAVVLAIGFGIKVKSNDDKFIKIAEDASYALGHGGAPAGTPVDFFPLLRYMPRWLHDRSLKFANDHRFAIENLHNKPYEDVMEIENKTESLMQIMIDLQKREGSKLSSDDIKGAAGAVFAAGQDTTWATLIVFTLNMLLHPEVQRKAQQALDAVVGRHRLPTFEDRSQLPYLDRIVQETLRWCPVSPIGVPHRSLEDDFYKEYFIPAGSFVYANARAMTHDENTYRNPDDFNPDRYAPEAEGGFGEPFPVGQFGFGRRVCVGQHLAEASVWIVVASVLSTMNIEHKLDENGNKIVPEVSLTNGLTSHPKDVTCRFVPRDSQSVEVIRNAKLH